MIQIPQKSCLFELNHYRHQRLQAMFLGKIYCCCQSSKSTLDLTKSFSLHLQSSLVFHLISKGPMPIRRFIVLAQRAHINLIQKAGDGLASSRISLFGPFFTSTNWSTFHRRLVQIYCCCSHYIFDKSEIVKNTYFHHTTHKDFHCQNEAEYTLQDFPCKNKAKHTSYVSVFSSISWKSISQVSYIPSRNFHWFLNLQMLDRTSFFSWQFPSLLAPSLMDFQNIQENLMVPYFYVT